MVLKRAISLTIPVPVVPDQILSLPFKDLSDHSPFSQFHVRPVTINTGVLKRQFFSSFLFTTPISSEWFLSLLPHPWIRHVRALLRIALWSRTQAGPNTRTACSCEMLVSTYKTTQCHNLDYHNLYIYVDSIIFLHSCIIYSFYHDSKICIICF
jgi:hypothetical protein